MEWLKLAPTLLLGVALVLSVQAAGAKASRAALAVAAYFTVTVLASSAKILKYTLPFPEVVAVLDDLALVAFVHFVSIMARSCELTSPESYTASQLLQSSLQTPHATMHPSLPFSSQDAPRTKSKQLPLMTVMAAVLLLAVEGLLSKKGPAAFVMGLVNVSAPVASAMGLAALYACATAVARAALAVQERSVHAGRALGVALAVLLAMKAALVAPAVGPVLALVANDKTAKSITQWAVSYFLASSV